MRISWGTGIVIAIISFVGFIMYFVISMSTDKAYAHDLVTEDYYKTEIAFQNQLDKEKNAKRLAVNIRMKKTSEGLLIIFPEAVDYKNIKGKVFLYRPSDKHLDREIDISLSSNQLLVPDKSLIDGRWNISIDWSNGPENYFFKQKINY